MNTPFQSAMHDFVQASNAYADEVHGIGVRNPNAAQTLAQAGDVLESALRQMIREEVANDQEDDWIDPTTCSHPITRSGGLGKPDICERCGEEL